MMEVVVTVDPSKFDRVMADWPARLASAQGRALRYIGQTVASRATQAFRTPSLRPSPWAPRKDSKSKHPLLIKSGNLRQSITWRLKSSDTVEVGSSAKYALYHQTGTKRMPARPFFPFDKNGGLTPLVKAKIDRNVRRIFGEVMSHEL